MSDDTDSDLDRTTGTPDPSDVLVSQRIPIIDEKLAATLISKYHRFKGLLEENEQVQLIEFHLEEDFEAADTALSDIYALKLTYRLPRESTDRNVELIVKQLPQDPFARLFVKEAQFDLREIKFYTKIVPDMVEFLQDCLPDQSPEKQLPIPKCYYPIGDEDLDSSLETILILEDLKSHDYYSPDFSKGLSLNQATLALEAIAKTHAVSLAMRISKNCSLNETYPFLFQTDKATDSYQMLLDRGLPQLAAFLDKKPSMSDVLKSIQNIGQEMKNVISALLLPKGPLALLTHTDFWCNNLLFRGDNRHCIILDWQMVTYSRPTNDIALLIISSLPSDLRRQNTDHLLNKYWQAFTSFSLKLNVDIEGTFAYSRADLQEDYRKSQLLAILLCIGSVDVALGNASAEQRLMDVLKDLYAEQIFSQQTIAQCLAS